MINCTITAHAGAMNTEDNTPESIKVGAENADIIEVDVRFDKGGVPVLSHNSLKGNEMTLEEVFKIVAPQGTKVNLDLKEFDGLAAVDALAERYGMTERVFYTGVGVNEAEKVKAQSKIPYYLNFFVFPLLRYSEGYIMNFVNELKKHGAIGANCDFRNVSRKFVDIIHKNGFEVSLWTVNSEKDIRRVIAKCPDNITSRNPDLVKKIMTE